MVSLPTGNVAMLHERGVDSIISTRSGGYSAGPCKGAGIANTAMTVFNGASSGAANVLGGANVALMPLAVDAAVTRDGQKLAIVGPAQGPMHLTPSPISIVDNSMLAPSDPCQPPLPGPTVPPTAEPTAAAYDGKNQLYVQSRNPAVLYNTADGSSITFDGAEDKTDEGHRLFHTPTSGQIACVSCHPEGGDDSHTWNFDTIGPRRTQHLRGGIMATAPFHWDGDMTDIGTLMNQVFTGRMGGTSLTQQQIDSVGKWLDSLPPLPKSPAADAMAAARGKALFEDATVGCATCHSGPHFTNNQSMNVGTGKAFQVPSLVGIAGRAPYMHSGCAATLRARFDPTCGGGDAHGKTSQLTSGQIDDLVAYLATL
jgi:mono/diheme cytochrome c family protein